MTPSGRIALAVALLASSVVWLGVTGTPGQGQDTVETSNVNRAAGLAAWQQLYSVMSSPRCVNCHTASAYPQQGDDRHRHLFNVVRGPDGHGVAALQCATCHQSANADSTGVPGAPGWHLAPLSMKWQDASDNILASAAVCKTVTDRSNNGGLDGAAIVRHHQTELVQWAWKPGRRNDGTPRLVPPIGYEEFMKATRQWVSAGMPCPQ